MAVVALGARPAAAIANGEDAADGSYRFTVRLTMTDLPAAGGGTRDSWCTGALVAPRWVITAGHCFRDGDGRRVSRTVARRTVAVVGRTDLRGRDGHEVEVVAVHQAGTADVALAELRTAITDVVPLRIGAGPPAAGEVVRLTGYGLTTAAGSATRRLQTGRFTVDRVGDSVLETSGRAPRPDTSPCPHDSGGPYFRERPGGTAELVAVVSNGPGCPHVGADFSARTDNLSGWLNGTMRPGPFGRATIGIGGAVLLLLVTALLAAFPLRRAGRRRAAAARVTAPGKATR